MKTLLEKAKEIESYKRRKPTLKVTNQNLELALAYARNEITTKQFEYALGVGTGTSNNFAMRIIYGAVKEGMLVRRDIKK